MCNMLASQAFHIFFVNNTNDFFFVITYEISTVKYQVLLFLEAVFMSIDIFVFSLPTADSQHSDVYIVISARNLNYAYN